MPADSHFVHPQFPGDDYPTIIGGSVFLRQPAVEALVCLAKERAAQSLRLLRHRCFQLTLGLDVR